MIILSLMGRDLGPSARSGKNYSFALKILLNSGLAKASSGDFSTPFLEALGLRIGVDTVQATRTCSWLPAIFGHGVSLFE